MTQKQKDQLEKFKKFTSWMCGDISRTMFCAKANFLVAQGLVNYTETLGSFLRPYKTSKKGKIVRTTTGERFLDFFVRLGAEYQKLLRKYWGKNTKKVYDDLRNGLTHEYLIKRKYYTVYGVDKFMSDQALDNLTIKIGGKSTRCTCGVIHQKTKDRKGYWHFVNGKYFVDFKRAIGERARGQIRSWLITVDSGKGRFRGQESLFVSGAENPPSARGRCHRPPDRPTCL